MVLKKTFAIIFSYFCFMLRARLSDTFLMAANSKKKALGLCLSFLNAADIPRYNCYGWNILCI